MKTFATVGAVIVAAGLAWAAAQQAVNTTCPVKGEPVKPNITAMYKGKTIAFC